MAGLLAAAAFMTCLPGLMAIPIGPRFTAHSADIVASFASAIDHVGGGIDHCCMYRLRYILWNENAAEFLCSARADPGVAEDAELFVDGALFAICDLCM